MSSFCKYLDTSESIQPSRHPLVDLGPGLDSLVQSPEVEVHDSYHADARHGDAKRHPNTRLPHRQFSLLFQIDVDSPCNAGSPWP